MTVSLDRAMAERARKLVGARSVSDAIEAALERLIYDAEVRRSVEGYIAIPPTPEETGISHRPYPALDTDNTDWEPHMLSSPREPQR